MKLDVRYIIAILLIVIGILLIINPVLKKAEINLPDGTYVAEIRLWDYIRAYFDIYAMESYRLENLYMDDFTRRLMENLVNVTNNKLKEDYGFRQVYDGFRRKYQYIQICQIRYERVFSCGTLVFYDNEIGLSYQISSGYPTILFKKNLIEAFIVTIEQGKLIPVIENIIEGYKTKDVIFLNTDIFEFIDALA
ncbi:MAG: hypothetical protein QXW35_01605 [Candidatus Aenigmatarchaeota archaeon]